MKKVVVLVAAGLALGAAAPGFAADLSVKAKPAAAAPAPAPAPFDILFGTAFTTDYELRGVSQSAHKGAVQGYTELDYKPSDWLTLYSGVWGSSLYTGFADAEFDFSGGARFSRGNFGLDLGYVFYDYPGGKPNGFGSFGEFYAKPSYKFNDWLTIAGVVDGGNNFNDKVTLLPPWVGNGDAYYYSGNAVVTLPWSPMAGVTVSLNPEVGHQSYGSGPKANLGVADYNWWDVGLDFNYKAITLDLRYWDTDVSAPTAAQCITTTGTDACSSRFVAMLKFDTALSALK